MSRLLLALLVLWPAASAWAESKTQLFVDPQGPVGVDERVQMTIRIEAGGNASPQRPVFGLDNLKIIGGPSQSTSIQVINGVASQSISFIWLVQPLKLGPARIFDIGVPYNGTTRLTAPDHQIEVVANPPARPQRRPNDPFSGLFGNDPFGRDPFDSFFDQRRRRPQQLQKPEVFLEAEVDLARPFISQQLIYTLWLYTDVTVRSVSPTKLPDFKGFWTEVIPVPERAETEMVERDGRRMGRIVLLERALFPRQEGKLMIEAVEVEMVAVLPDGNRFGGLVPVQDQLTRRSNAVTVEVKALPEPKPAGFADLVGQLTVKSDLQPQQIEAGQAATLKIELEGRGHIQGLSAPELPAIAGLQYFPPQQQNSESLRNKQVIGKRTWSYVIVPERSGTFTLPPIAIPYFDAKSGRYELAQTQAQTLGVKSATKAVEAGKGVSLHPIRTSALPAADTPAGSSKVLQIALFLMPWALVLLAEGRRRTKSPRAKNAHGSAFEQALTAALAESRPKPAAAALEEAWRNWLQERFGLERGLAPRDWPAALRERGVKVSACEELAGLAEDLNYLRFAPELSSTDDLRRDLIERSRQLIRSLA